MADSKFTAKSFPQGGFTTKIKMGNHEIISDQAKEDGGNDKGACPASLLSAAICGCETMITSVLIEKMRLKVKSFNVEVTGLLSDDYAKDGSGFHDIHTTFSFDSDEPDEKLQKLVEMVEASCPVMNSIKKPGKFHSEIKKI